MNTGNNESSIMYLIYISLSITQRLISAWCMVFTLKFKGISADS